MGVYLGDAGWVEVRRTSVDAVLSATVNPADIDISGNRIGFEREWGSLFTGDLVNVRSDDKTSLSFIANWPYESIERYVHVDDMEGLRFYDNYPDAINGFQGPSIPLQAPVTPQQVSISINDPARSLVGKMTRYELTTSRETVDITALGEEFRMQYTAGLISGQGRLECFWDYRDWPCSASYASDEKWEWANYFHQLIIRTELGSSFVGRFIIKGSGAAPYDSGISGAVEQQLHYRALCTVTNTSISFAAGQPVVSLIDFVTTGPIRMRLTPLPTPDSTGSSGVGAFLAREDRDGLITKGVGERIVI